jgi:hypothetical protein
MKKDPDPQYLLIFKGVFYRLTSFFQRTEEAAVDNAMGDQDSSDEEQVRQTGEAPCSYFL